MGMETWARPEERARGRFVLGRRVKQRSRRKLLTIHVGNTLGAGSLSMWSGACGLAAGRWVWDLQTEGEIASAKC